MRRRIVDLLTEIGQRWNIGTERIVLGGFSQGAMLSTAVALQERLPLAGVCALSGTLLCESQWRQGAAETAALSFFQSHGRYDPVLPFANAEALRDLLTGQGHAVDFVPFDGQHEIPSAVVRRLANWLVERLA
jgi:phospholipase/carboxylesterase